MSFSDSELLWTESLSESLVFSDSLELLLIEDFPFFEESDRWWMIFPGETNCCSLNGEWLTLKTCSSSSTWMSLMLVLEIKFSFDFFSFWPSWFLRLRFWTATGDVSIFISFFGQTSSTNSLMSGLTLLVSFSSSFCLCKISEQSYDNVYSTYLRISGSTFLAFMKSIRFWDSLIYCKLRVFCNL